MQKQWGMLRLLFTVEWHLHIQLIYAIVDIMLLSLKSSLHAAMILSVFSVSVNQADNL